MTNVTNSDICMVQNDDELREIQNKGKYCDHDENEKSKRLFPERSSW